MIFSLFRQGEGLPVTRPFFDPASPPGRQNRATVYSPRPVYVLLFVSRNFRTCRANIKTRETIRHLQESKSCHASTTFFVSFLLADCAFSITSRQLSNNANNFAVYSWTNHVTALLNFGRARWPTTWHPREDDVIHTVSCMSNSVRKAECREPKTTFFFSSQRFVIKSQVCNGSVELHLEKRSDDADEKKKSSAARAFLRFFLLLQTTTTTGGKKFKK